MKKRMSFLAVLLVSVVLTACGAPKQEGTVKETEQTSQETESSEAGIRTITDVAGREVEIPGKVERIVALSASDCEIVYALGGGDLLVGRGEYCNYPEEAEALAAVPSGSEMNMEQILALEPQVVLMSKMDQTIEQVEALEKAGIAVCVDDETDIEGVYQSIRMVGEVIGRQEEAEAVVMDMKHTFDELQKKTEGKEGGSVYFEVSPLEYGLWTTGSGTFMNEIAEMLGLTNIFADVTGWAEISEEQVLERDPDYIVTIAMYYGEGPTPEEEILGRTGWQEMTAIQNGNVYNANADEISRPGPRLANAAQMLYEFVYEEK